MRVLFWGTPDFAVPSLAALAGEGHDIVGVVTQPDRPAGRGQKVRASAVKLFAEEDGYPVLQPAEPRGDGFMADLRALDPEISVVVAYGRILAPEVLSLPPRGSLNVHASLLPELRGAAPINWAIARGHDTTGVTIMRMTEGMDEGPILLQNPEPILDEETASELSLRLSEVGAETLVAALALLDMDLLEEIQQEHEKATYAPKVSRAVARIDWDMTAAEVERHIRGMDAVPGAWTELRGQPVKLFSPRAVDRSGPAGTVLAADAEAGLVVAADEGAVALGEVQPTGRKRMPSADWIRGRGVEAGQIFT